MVNHEQVTMMATRVLALRSEATGKNYKISIALPLAYQNDEPVKIAPFDQSLNAWPVIYVLDPNWLFGLTTDMVRYMSWCGRTTDALVVGIGYPEAGSVQATWQQTLLGRTHDLTPVRSKKSEVYNGEWLKSNVKTGGGALFLRFMKEELIPLIDKEYHTDPAKRTLLGHSHGGGFALYALFQAQGLFNTYIASSPSVDFADHFLLALESEYAKNHETLNANVYLSAGELEEVAGDDTTLTDIYRLAAQMESHKYNQLSLIKHVFPDCNHCEVIAPALHEGLRMALRK